MPIFEIPDGERTNAATMTDRETQKSSAKAFKPFRELRTTMERVALERAIRLARRLNSQAMEPSAGE